MLLSLHVSQWSAAHTSTTRIDAAGCSGSARPTSMQDRDWSPNVGTPPPLSSRANTVPAQNARVAERVERHPLLRPDVIRHVAGMPARTRPGRRHAFLLVTYDRRVLIRDAIEKPVGH